MGWRSTKIAGKLVDYANTTNVEYIVGWIYCWPKGFIPWLINLQLFAPNLIKWLPGECADWFFDNIMTWSNCFHRRYSMSRQENSTLVNEHALNREPVPLTGDQALLYHHFSFLWFEREKNNAWYIHSTSHQPLPRLHNLTFAWPVMLLANQRLPDGNQILARKSPLKSKIQTEINN